MNQISYGRRLVGQATIAIAVTIPVAVPYKEIESYLLIFLKKASMLPLLE